ncbi:MAG: class I SAM-dependent methyltransferase [Candidatus Thorarchaeota archaeon]|jgi:SAM-dependent methyltransferase
MTEEFKRHLAQQTYDKLYQDIKPIGMVGYSKSFQTWNTIKDIVKWQGTSVVDLGCFHGYFCFRIEEAGASKVVGLDAADFALVTTRLIAKLEGSNATEFQHWHDEEPIPEADITICLNAFHHFKDPIGCLRRIKSKRVIFEVYSNQESQIASVFSITERRPSHRDGRVILLAQRDL